MGSVERRIARTVESLHPVVVKNPSGAIIYEGGVRAWNRIMARCKARPAYRKHIQARIDAGLRLDG